MGIWDKKPAADVWRCGTCYVENKLDVVKCGACSSAKADPAATAAKKGKAPVATTANAAKPAAVSTTAAVPAVPAATAAAPKTGIWAKKATADVWRCGDCYVENKLDIEKCGACGKAKAVADAGGKGAAAVKKPAAPTVAGGFAAAAAAAKIKVGMPGLLPPGSPPRMPITHSWLLRILTRVCICTPSPPPARFPWKHACASTRFVFSFSCLCSSRLCTLYIKGSAPSADPCEHIWSVCILG